MSFVTRYAAYFLVMASVLASGNVTWAGGSQVEGSKTAWSKDKPFVNSLGMRLVPLSKTKVLVAVWETRVKDFQVFIQETGSDMSGGMLVPQNGGWKLEPKLDWQNPGFKQTPEDPVVGVSWKDAKAFCEWLSARERKSDTLRAGQSYRLPTDAEWSLAVGLQENAGGLPKEKGVVTNQYPWGLGWPPPIGAGNYAGNEARVGDWPSDWKTIEGFSDGFARTSPVGSFTANALGVYDLGGNVWEWCDDWYDGEQAKRTLRGGAWCSSNANRLLSSSRAGFAQTERYSDNGFRVVLVTD